MDYRDSLNLPKTAFPMKANLPVREPEWLEKWETDRLYEKARSMRRNAPKFVLHDGPPYANGDIHAGTALNKILKDMINRYWTTEGYDVAYVPGWDTHGLPIEMRALKTLGVSQHQIDPLTLRQECAKVADFYIGAMTQQFKRLGIEGDWQNPYVTMKPAYEAAELRVFADMVAKELVYRDLKPVYWCPHCETALAEGEIEYNEHESDSIYVAFPLKPHSDPLPEGTQAVIWTTTPWTLPANVAIALHPDLLYTVVETQTGRYLVGKDLVHTVATKLGWDIKKTWGPWEGKELDWLQANHPYLDLDVLLILGEHVTQESGTGLVHTAPGHGAEDFDAARHYQLPVVQPLNDHGVYFETTPLVGGMFYQKANPVVIEKLKENHALLQGEKYHHQYAFCWRCKNPVIYRATSQWFLSIEKIRGDLMDATYSVHWDPSWGGDRMRNMVTDREDWCLSRQRSWGLPIPAFYCDSCGHSILEANVIRHVADLIGKFGSNAWWQHDAEFFLPDGLQCPECGGTAMHKEKDIFDVWLDSGSSQAAVLADHSDLSWPADLVLEGNDQYRGWFNSLLTTGVSTRGRAPYKMVLTHGMVLDKSGREMHKSLGNTVDPLELVKKYGSDILRLWVATSDYRTDVRISEELMRQLSETYRKIRNTFRFFLGNLTDFTPRSERPSIQDPLNRWAIHTTNAWAEQARKSFRQFLFHSTVHSLVRIMTIDLSSFYLDVIKDRLYTLAKDDPMRRETQAVLAYMLDVFLIGIAPVLVFTSEEIYQYMPKLPNAEESVHLTTWPAMWDIGWQREEETQMGHLLEYRDVILKALESIRSQKIIGNSLEAQVLLTVPANDKPLSLEEIRLLGEMTLVAELRVHSGEEIAASAEKTVYARCERCWRYTNDVGTSTQYADLCGRCAEVMGAFGDNE